jgi:type IX secretion system PorP/SprF family membrane protein
VASPFQTIAASFDMRFNQKKNTKAGIFAAGINFFNDQAGDLKVATTNVNLHLAYHLKIDDNSKIGLGMYIGYGQRSINPGAARWGSQYVNGLYDATVTPSIDFLSRSSFGFLDAGTGVLYSFNNRNSFYSSRGDFVLNLGLAGFHVNRPGYSFISPDQDKLHIRYAAFVNAEIGVGENGNGILPGIYFQRQATQSELMIGAYYKHQLKPGSKFTGYKRPASLFYGLFGRVKDALVAKIMFEYDCYSIGAAYDLNISQLRTVSNSFGGFELFLRFNLSDGGGFRSRI